MQGKHGLTPIQYGKLGNLAIYEGDIILGTVAEAEAVKDHVESNGTEPLPEGFRIINWSNKEQYIWPGGIVYYENPNNNDERTKVVKEAMDHWQEKTSITFEERTNQPNYVAFQDGDGCASNVGMLGGKQTITLSPNCSTGNVIHELGHTVGLFHEHTRQDRDQYVTIRWEYIETGKRSNFEIPSNNISEDVGGYDYDSIMHYGPDAFSNTDKEPTIVPKESGVTIGQRNGLSADDITTINTMYP